MLCIQLVTKEQREQYSNRKNDQGSVQRFSIQSSHSWKTVTRSMTETVDDPLPKYLLSD